MPVVCSTCSCGPDTGTVSAGGSGISSTGRCRGGLAGVESFMFKTLVKLMARKYTCSRCGKPGHSSRWCPKAPNRGHPTNHNEPPKPRNPVQEAREAAERAEMAANQAAREAERAQEAARKAVEPKRSLYLTDQQYHDALRRLRNYIAPQPDRGRFTGGELEAWDSDCIGDKDTECSWGLCTGRPEQWPPETRMWPERPLMHDGRVYGVKYRENGQFCPFDRRAPEGHPMHGMASGCFGRCRIFTRKKGEPRPTREEALALFDATIAEFRPKLTS